MFPVTTNKHYLIIARVIFGSKVFRWFGSKPDAASHVLVVKSYVRTFEH